MQKDSLSSNKSKMIPKHKNRVLLFLIAGLLAVVLCIALFIPLSMSNGLDRFSGEEERAAKAQLTAAPHLLGSADRYLSLILKYRVEQVYKTPNDKLTFWCGENYNKNATNYSVVIGKYTLFGIKVGEITRHDTCLLLNS